jgi:glutaminyl-peptide cyclotransferase
VVLRSVALASQYFGERATLFQGKILQLTYQSQTAFVYDAATFAPLEQFFYVGEGWGLTHDDRRLIMSDSTSQIRVVDPATFHTVNTINVHDSAGTPITNINELEYINGEIYANIWLTNSVVRIDPSSGVVV